MRSKPAMQTDPGIEVVKKSTAASGRPAVTGGAALKGTQSYTAEFGIAAVG